MPYKKHGELFPFNLNGSFIRLIFLPPSGLYIFVLQTLDYKVYSFSTDLLKHISMNCVIIECVHITNQSFREYMGESTVHIFSKFSYFILQLFLKCFSAPLKFSPMNFRFFVSRGKWKAMKIQQYLFYLVKPLWSFGERKLYISQSGDHNGNIFVKETIKIYVSRGTWMWAK